MGSLSHFREFRQSRERVARVRASATSPSCDLRCMDRCPALPHIIRLGESTVSERAVGWVVTNSHPVHALSSPPTQELVDGALRNIQHVGSFPQVVDNVLHSHKLVFFGA